MARLFFGLLLILGLGAACFGGWQMFAPQELAVSAPVAPIAAPEPAPPPPPPPPAPVAAAPPPPAEPSAAAEEPVFGPSAIPRGASSASPTNAEPLATAGPAVARPRLIEETLQEVPVAYETPSVASYGKPFDVTFSLDATGAETATESLPGVGEVVEAQARVSDRVKASLVGAAFDIELISPTVQLLGTDTANIWRWRVTPKEAGEQALYVELFAMTGEDARPVRTFNGQIEVEVTRFQKAVSLATAANPLAVFLGGIGSTLGGLFGFIRFIGRRS